MRREQSKRAAKSTSPAEPMARSSIVEPLTQNKGLRELRQAARLKSPERPFNSPPPARSTPAATKQAARCSSVVIPTAQEMWQRLRRPPSTLVRRSRRMPQPTATAVKWSYGPTAPLRSTEQSVLRAEALAAMAVFLKCRAKAPSITTAALTSPPSKAAQVRYCLTRPTSRCKAPERTQPLPQVVLAAATPIRLPVPPTRRSFRLVRGQAMRMPRS